jgi:hypothetical protein
MTSGDHTLQAEAGDALTRGRRAQDERRNPMKSMFWSFVVVTFMVIFAPLAHADTFDWTFFDAVDTGSGTFTTDVTGLITAMTGTENIYDNSYTIDDISLETHPESPMATALSRFGGPNARY